MITVMRRYRKTLQVALLLVIAAFVITSVVVFGAGSGVDRQDVVATVNGETIPVERYERRYRAYLDAYSQVYRGRFTPEMAEQLGLPQQVVSDLVQEAVVVQRAREEGLAVTDEELNAQMHLVPAFQETGRFSLRRYEEFLRQRGLSKPAFEEDVRRELTRMKVENVVKSGVKVSDAELEQAFAQRHEEIRAAWALVDLTPIVASITPTDEELQKYLSERGDEFRLPERRRVQYVAVNPKDVAVTVTPAEVEKYYQEQAKEFETPRQVKAAHILVRVAETGGSEAEDKARATVADIIRRARAGEDFAKLARELSEDPGSARSGGDLGYVSRGDMVRPFEDALFALKAGEISAEPVRTPFGYHAIKVSDVREESKKPLAAVAAQIRDRLAAERADAAARAKAEEIRSALQRATDFMVEANARGLAPLETTVARPERPAGVDAPEPFADAAFTLALGGVSVPVKTPGGWVVMKNVEVLPAAVPALADIRDKVAAAVKRQKAEALALERATRLQTDARSGDFTAAARKAGATVGETPRFSRAKPAERLPGDAMVAALRTPVGSLTEPVKAQQGYYVLKVLERTPPDMGGLATEREKLTRDVMAQKQSHAWEAWISNVRAEARVTVSPRFQPRRG